ncbi:histone-lysine N-methyltransferase [Flagelloscypha sp. PMI_526]|nr:histone-lysine N-methyltransferase [Flagelloscypha sp. PMI_526]
MATLTSTVIRPSADLNFFSGKPATTHSPVQVSVVKKFMPVSTPSNPAPVASTSAAPVPPKKKRKSATPASDSAPNPKKRKITDLPRKRVSKSRVPSRQSSRPASTPPPPVYRSSGTASAPLEYTVEERDWTTRDSEDPDPFKYKRTSFQVVSSLIKKYNPYFRNHDNPDDTTFQLDSSPPIVQLEYPFPGAVENFILAAPKDKDHYNPFYDLEKSLHTIIKYYVPEKWRFFFGPMPAADCASDDTPETSRASTPVPNGASSPSMTPGHTPPQSSSPFPLSSSSDDEIPPCLPTPNEDLLRTFQRAVNTHNGPVLQHAMREINELLLLIKHPPVPSTTSLLNPSNAHNSFRESVNSWRTTGLPKDVLMRILDENYQRSVGPYVVKLKQYQAFTSLVYGELMPSLVYEMLRKTNVRQNMLFMDLGSGVGNVVIQAALQTGCRSFGVELNDAPAEIAANMVAPFKARCRMWGVTCGDIELVKGDMLTHPRVSELLPQADVVLVDNKVFTQQLNESLKPKFLDLKEGAIVISLKPFVSSLNGRLTERNIDDMATIFDVTEHEFASGSVSWGNGGGSYYIHRVDRVGYAQSREQFENQRRSRRGR